MLEQDDSARLVEAVTVANEHIRPLWIQGTGSKSFLGIRPQGSMLSLADHCGVVDYRPEELYLTARAGTPVSTLKEVLRQHHQRLAFDPPEFEGRATFGGALACGLAGPARPWYGAVRDSMLGVRIINGLGEALNFGGQVMKNVAGYDVTKLMAGAFGTLGVLLEATVKVIPEPDCEVDCSFSLAQDAALERVLEIARSPLPVSATCYFDELLTIRFSGNSQGVNATLNDLGADGRHSPEHFWNSLRDHSHDFFRPRSGLTLWRLSLPPAAAYPVIPAPHSSAWLTEWAGAQRWLWTDAPEKLLGKLVADLGGYAQSFSRFPANSALNLSTELLRYHQRLKQAFDPNGVLNPHRMSEDF